MSHEDTKSVDSSEYDSLSLSESVEGVPIKASKKKKKLSFFHRKKYKEEKTSSANGSVETEIDHFSMSSTDVSSFCSERQASVESTKSEMTHTHYKDSGTSYRISSLRETTSSGSFTKKPAAASGDSHKLQVRLRGGENLVARDTNGLSDPYVKFKVDGRTAFKSRICKETLNPHWDEEFEMTVFPTSVVNLRVYDKDVASRDDFMGSAAIDLDRLTDKFDDIRLKLEDSSTDEDLGFIHFAARLLPPFSEVAPKGIDVVDSVVENNAAPLPNPVVEKRKSQIKKESIRHRNNTVHRNNLHPGAVVTLQLVSGSDIPARDANGLSDPYVKLSLGKVKRKSKVCYKTLSPVWKEEFTFCLYTPESSILDISVYDKDNYSKDDFIGRCDLDLWALTREETHSLSLSLVDTPGKIHFLVTVHAVDPPDVPVTRYDLSEIRLKYSLASSFNNLSDIGFAEIRIASASGLRSADMNGKSDPFCVVQLCNARAQTHTCYRTLDPVWNRVFSFPIRDIHDVVDFWVFDQDPNYEREFLGRVCVPLLRCQNGEEKVYYLKDRKLKERVKGSLTVQISYIFNPVRAAIRTFNPREEMFMEDAAKFKKAVLTQNFSRVWRIVQSILATAEFVNSCFTWQNKTRSFIAFIMFLLIVWNFELYMLPVMLLMLLLKNYVDIFIRKVRPPRHLMKAEEAQRENEDDDDEDENSSKPSILKRLRALEEILTKVQGILDTIASLGERVYNTFAWSVPYLGWLLVIVLCIGSLILYLIPLRIIVLLWGINKFTKRLRKPNYIPNNEVLDYLSRIPSNVELDEYREYEDQTLPNSKKKR